MPHSHISLLLELTPKIPWKIRMAGCYNQCHINALAAHAGMKLNFYNSILTSIVSLNAMDRYLGLIQTPLNKNRTRKIFETATLSKNRCEADLKNINDVLRNGCPRCILRRCNAQEQLPIISNEIIEELEILWTLRKSPLPKLLLSFSPEI